MGNVTGSPLEIAAARAGRIAARGSGNWRKMLAYGAAAGIVFIGTAIAYSSLKKVKERSERRKRDAAEAEETEAE